MRAILFRFLLMVVVLLAGAFIIAFVSLAFGRGIELPGLLLLGILIAFIANYKKRR